MSVVNLFIYNLYVTSILVYTKYIHYCAILLDFYFIFFYAIHLCTLFIYVMSTTRTIDSQIFKYDK